MLFGNHSWETLGTWDGLRSSCGEGVKERVDEVVDEVGKAAPSGRCLLFVYLFAISGQRVHPSMQFATGSLLGCGVQQNSSSRQAKRACVTSRMPVFGNYFGNYQHPHEQTLSQRRNPAACRGENSQGRWKRHHFHPRLTYTQSLGDVEPVPVPTALQVLQAGTRNWLFQCRLGATRRLCPCEKREQVETQKDTLTDQHQEHHGILNIRFMTSQAKSLPAPNPETNTDKKKPRKAHLPPSRCIPISALAPPAARMASSRPHWPDPDSATTPLSLTAFS